MINIKICPNAIKAQAYKRKEKDHPDWRRTAAIEKRAIIQIPLNRN